MSFQSALTPESVPSLTHRPELHLLPTSGCGGHQVPALETRSPRGLGLEAPGCPILACGGSAPSRIIPASKTGH